MKVKIKNILILGLMFHIGLSVGIGMTLHIVNQKLELLGTTLWI